MGLEYCHEHGEVEAQDDDGIARCPECGYATSTTLQEAIYFAQLDDVGHSYTSGEDEADNLARKQAHALQAGDEVTWNDPDDGICTKTFRILRIEWLTADVTQIAGDDGSELEANYHELSANEGTEELCAICGMPYATCPCDVTDITLEGE